MTTFSGFDEAVVVDVETTGLDPEKDRVISVAMVRAHFAELKSNPNGLHGETMDVAVNPQCRIPPESSRIHGITDRDVADKGSNHGLRKGSNLDSAAEIMSVNGRTSTKHDATEDARMAFEVATLFYMMDNRIRIPGGKPKPPSRTRRSDYRNTDDSKSKGSTFSPGKRCTR